METTRTIKIDKTSPKSAGNRSDQLGVPQRIKRKTQGRAMSYAVKHNLTMAETIERAIALLIESDMTPEPERFDMRKIPDDVFGLNEVTLKFTKSEMKAIRERFGPVCIDSSMEELLISYTDG